MKKVSNSFSELEHFELVVDRVVESGIDLTTIQHDWAVIGYICASFGEAGRKSFHKLSSLYPDYNQTDCDKQFSYCLKSYHDEVKVGTFYKMCQDHGIDISLPRGRHVKTEEQKQEEQKKLMEKGSSHLRDLAHWRFNTWLNRPEILEPASTWRPVNDRDLSTTEICQRTTFV